MSSNFIPLSSELGVTGTSYRVQLGKLDNKWSARILKGKDVIATTTLPELNGNLVVGFVMQETAIPNLNPYQIMKTVQFITKEAQNNEQRMKERGSGIPAPVQAPVQAEPERRAPVDSEVASDEDQRSAYRLVARPKEDSPPPAESQPAPAPVASSQAQPVTISSGRKLKAIPSAADAGSAHAPAASQPAPAPAPAHAATPAPTATSTAAPAGIESMLARIEASIAKIEVRLGRIEEELFK